jgi:hypothetical protein
MLDVIQLTSAANRTVGEVRWTRLMMVMTRMMLSSVAQLGAML